MSPVERRSVGVIASLYAMRMIGLFMVLPVFMVLGKDLEGATPALLGMAIGAYGLTQALLQIPFGMLSDRFGRKPVIVSGLLIFAAGSLVAAVSDSVYGVIAGRFLQGAGAIASALMALLSDVTREEARTRAMAVVGMSIGLSFIVALLIGPIFAQWVGLSGLFALTAVMALLGMVLLAAVPTPRVQTHHLDTSVDASRFSDVLRHPDLLRLDWGIFSLHLMLTGLFVMLPRLLAEVHQLPVSRHGWLYIGVMGAGFVAMVPFIIIGEKRRKLREVFIGAVALLVASLAVLDGVRNHFWGVVAALFLFFMAFNLLEASLPSLVSKIAPAGLRGSAMGVYASSQFFGAFLGGAVGGWLYGHFQYEGVLGFVIGVGVLWLLVASFMNPPPYATSMTLHLSEAALADPAGTLNRLRSLDGVEDVVILEEEGLAYLKVDKAKLDLSVLTQGPWARNDESKV